MKRLRVLLGVLIVLALRSQASGQDKVYLKSKEKPVTGSITQESAKGIVLGKNAIPAEDIIEIEYELASTLLQTGHVRPALYLETPSLSPDKKAKRNLTEALKSIEKAFVDKKAEIAKEKPMVRRHLEFKLAWLRALLAQEEGKNADTAIAQLKDFKDRHPDCWQIGRALQALASLQITQKDYAEAENTLNELARADVAPDVKGEAQLQGAKISLLAGKPDVALKKLQVLVGSLPKNSRYQVLARIAEAECLAATKKMKEATSQLKEIVKDAKDPGLKAAAYNTLGKNMYDSAIAAKDDNLLKEARWEFLWVDVVYNQDKEEHAKALYYLWRIFARLGEAERADECHSLLVNDRQFAGLEYQKLAQRESKK